jgi:hypothetical protein
MSDGPATPQTPRNPRVKDGWRAAAAAYRRVIAETHKADPAFKAARAALKEVLPHRTDHEAMLETHAAVYYASWAHPDWLYSRTKPKD